MMSSEKLVLLILSLANHAAAILLRQKTREPSSFPVTLNSLSLRYKSPIRSDVTVPNRSDLVQGLYKGQDPISLFTNPRHLAFNGDLKWSNIGEHKEDACFLVEKAQAAFMVETGCYVGTSTKKWSECIGKRDGTVLAIDTWLGDLASWVERIDQDSRDVHDDVLRDGRSMLYDQFMLNMQKNNITNVIPMSATSLVGARWLATENFWPQLVYVDTAHEEGETALEVEMYWKILLPGGILAGDDYPGWAAVKHDVDEFVKRRNLTLQFAPSGLTWYVVKDTW
jgi:hypothetical protein